MRLQSQEEYNYMDAVVEGLGLLALWVIGVVMMCLVVFSVSGCKFHAYGDSSGDTTGDTTTADDGSVVNDDEVSAGGDIVTDDGGGVIEGGGVEVVSDDEELLEELTDLELCRETFLWEPEGESGELVILFPEECPDFIEACVFAAPETETIVNEDGFVEEVTSESDEECQPVFGKDTVTGRLKFQFDHDGESYTGDILATDDEGTVFGFSVSNPAVRNDL